MRRPAALLLLALAGCRPGERPAAPLVDSTALPGLHVAPTPAGPAAEAPSHYIFDRPFLVFLRKRGGGRPFLALYVDGPEALVKH